jgi:hypothetical protein
MQRAPDAEGAERARAYSSVVLTFDLEFGTSSQWASPAEPSVIIFRLADE